MGPVQGMVIQLVTQTAVRKQKAALNAEPPAPPPLDTAPVDLVGCSRNENAVA